MVIVVYCYHCPFSITSNKGTCALNNQQIRLVTKPFYFYFKACFSLHIHILISHITFLAYVVTYTTVATTSTPGFGTIVQHIKISPNLTASTGLLSAVLQVSELYKYMSDQYNEFLPPYSW